MIIGHWELCHRDLGLGNSLVLGYRFNPPDPAKPTRYVAFRCFWPLSGIPNTLRWLKYEYTAPAGQ